MTEKRFTHNCFECKHCDWKYREDVPFPIHEYVKCKLGHEQTSYNTEFTEDFICKDYQHSYFTKTYLGYWLWGFIITLFLLSVISLLLELCGVI